MLGYSPERNDRYLLHAAASLLFSACASVRPALRAAAGQA
ncbi:hypothetical protein B8V81_2925 [Paenibacillus pasadenensis]|uniref:Uncharacterized protein n=1 Tax=Paenibacillus pasadenensis TaxID=217090 RepID=A0A2N5N2D8_9BACL|nr:hypothetical protein B8V81_2925 [Paenibacillus pasadenensis]